MLAANQSQQETKLLRQRILLTAGVVTALVLVLVFRLVYLQIAEYQRFSAHAQKNRIHLAPMPSVRGLIYDRNGVVLAENLHAYSVEILPEQVRDMEGLLGRLEEWIDLSEQDVARFMTTLKNRPAFEWRTLRTGLGEEEAARIALNQHRYPGIALRANLQRHYPHGDLTAHALGYVGRISPEDLATIDQSVYRGFAYIGRGGVEAHHESRLRGSAGVRQAETNAHGRVVNSITKRMPQAGLNLHLGMDLELQRQSVEALEGFEGAIVAIEPATGEILAFASAPGFDANPFVNGISEADYAALREGEGKPLLNRALYGRYAPGSTIKGFMVLAGLESGVDVTKKVTCPGWYRVGGLRHVYRDWKKGGHGRVDGRKGIVESCDIYFYQLANELGVDTIHTQLSRFGFGKETGVDLPLEPSGLLPTPEWKKRTQGQVWFPGDTVVSGIGQGYLLVTPLQLASAAAMLANRGVRVAPRFIRAIENPRTQARQTILPRVLGVESMADEDSYEYVIAAMRDVVHGEKGTARGSGVGLRYEMAGKTGTSQVKSIAQGEEYVEEEVEKQFRDHSLFIAFAPIDEPKIALAVIVEHAGSGGKVAAPIGRRLLDFYIIQQLGLYQKQGTVAQSKARPKAEQVAAVEEELREETQGEARVDAAGVEEISGPQ